MVRIFGYGDTTDFSSIEEAQETIRACGGDFGSVELRACGVRVLNERDELVGNMLVHTYHCEQCGEEVDEFCAEHPSAMLVSLQRWSR